MGLFLCFVNQGSVAALGDFWQVPVAGSKSLFLLCSLLFLVWGARQPHCTLL